MLENTSTELQRSIREEKYIASRRAFVESILEIHPIRVKNREVTREEFLKQFSVILKIFEKELAELGYKTEDVGIHPYYHFLGKEVSEEEKIKGIDELMELFQGKAYLRDILLFLSSKYSIEKVYYPGAGPDNNPTSTLGSQRVINLDLEELSKLGPGQKVVGDYSNNPFADNSFDITLIFGIKLEYPQKQIVDFIRVTRSGGFVILGDSNRSSDPDCVKILDRLLTPFVLPDELNLPQPYKRCRVYQKP